MASYIYLIVFLSIGQSFAHVFFKLGHLFTSMLVKFLLLHLELISAMECIYSNHFVNYGYRTLGIQSHCFYLVNDMQFCAGLYQLVAITFSLPTGNTVY